MPYNSSPHTVRHIENKETSFLTKHHVERKVHKQLCTLIEDGITSTKHKSEWTKYGDSSYVTNRYNMNITEK